MGAKKINIEIDKLTKSIENARSGDSFKTEVLQVTAKDVKVIRTKDWVFNWLTEYHDQNREVYKLVIIDNQTIVQGLVSIEDRGDHIYMHLIESSKFNKGASKVYLGVAGNLIAFVCKLSFEKGYSGFVSFESKTKLVEHYQGCKQPHC